jgi:transposase
MNHVVHLQKNSGTQPIVNRVFALQEKLVVLTQKEHEDLKWHGSYWKIQHSRAVKRELELKHELQQAKAEIINLKQRLFGKKSEKNARKDGGPNKRTSSTRNKGQQPGSTGHGRTPRPNLAGIEEIKDVAPEEKYCSVSGYETRQNRHKDRLVKLVYTIL